MSDLERKNLGGLASKPDYRANIVAAAMAGRTPAILPPSLATDFQKLGGPLNQNQTPACVSHAMAQLIKLWWFTKTGQIVNFSPRYLHVRSGLVSGSGPEDGRDPVTVMKISKQYGCATEATCPNNTSLSNTDYLNLAITPEMDADANLYKIPGYLLIPTTQYGVRSAIQAFGAVALLMRISHAFWTAKDGTITWDQAKIDPVRAPVGLNDVVSGHETVANQFNGPLDHFINSWGPVWAQNGESDYLWNEWMDYIVEAIAIAEIPATTLVLVQGLPRPGEFKHQFTSQIGYGSTGDEVKALQIALAIDGEFTYPEISGFYGDITRQAVLAFQRRYQVAPPAVLDALQGRNVGPATIGKLNQIFNH